MRCQQCVCGFRWTLAPSRTDWAGLGVAGRGRRARTAVLPPLVTTPQGSLVLPGLYWVTGGAGGGGGWVVGGINPGGANTHLQQSPDSECGDCGPHFSVMGEGQRSRSLSSSM